MSKVIEGEKFSIKVKKAWWAFLKIVPRPAKELAKKVLYIFFVGYRKLKKFFRYLLRRCPYLFHPLLFLRVKGIVRAKEGEVKGIIVYPPTVDWSWMKQRPHQLMEGLSNQGYLCFYVNINHKANTSHRSFEQINDNLYMIGNVHVLYQIKNPILLIGWTEHYNILKWFKNPRIIYDYLDDLSVSAHEVDDVKLSHHRYFLEKSDLVLVTAGNLLQDALKFRKDALSLPNAGGYEEFHLEKELVVPKDLKKIVETKKPIIGYYGALAAWFDYDLVKKLAETNKYEIVLLGPDYDETLKKHGLKKFENIHWLGLKDYSVLPTYLHFFDVATIPFVVNDITRSTSPVKLFEYMAGGKPIVTTALDECKKYESVLVAENHEDFLKKLEEALKLRKDKNYLKLLDKEARENTWEQRISKLTSKLKEVNEESAETNS